MNAIINKVDVSPVNMADRRELGIKAGDTVKVHQKIQDKGKTRIQVFDGIVLARKHGDEAGATFTVRKVTSGVGVEKIYPLYSPLIDKIEIVKRAKVRRAKLYYIREKVAREIKRQMRRMNLVSMASLSETEEAARVEAEAKAAEEAAAAAEAEATAQQAEAESSAAAEASTEEAAHDAEAETAAPATEETAATPAAETEPANEAESDSKDADEEAPVTESETSEPATEAPAEVPAAAETPAESTESPVEAEQAEVMEEKLDEAKEESSEESKK